MKSARLLLTTDSFVNLVLGGLLVLFPRPLVTAIGIPMPESAFYPSILGAVLVGIGIALAMEFWRPRELLGGLGLGGAIAINLCGGVVLAVWLARGGVDAPLRGYVLMWGLTGLLVGISATEMTVAIRGRRKRAQTHVH